MQEECLSFQLLWNLTFQRIFYNVAFSQKLLHLKSVRYLKFVFRAIQRHPFQLSYSVFYPSILSSCLQSPQWQFFNMARYFVEGLEFRAAEFTPEAMFWTVACYQLLLELTAASRSLHPALPGRDRVGTQTCCVHLSSTVRRQSSSWLHGNRRSNCQACNSVILPLQL